MSKLVLWLRIARKYRPLFALEMKWLDLQILPDGDDPNGTKGQLVQQQEVKVADKGGLISPKKGDVVMLRDSFIAKHPGIPAELLYGAWVIVDLNYGITPQARCRLQGSEKRTKLWWSLEYLRPFAPADLKGEGLV